MTPALLPARGGQRDGPRQSDPPPPRPPRHPSGGGHSRASPPPPSRQAGPPAAGGTRRPGLPRDPDRTRTPGGYVPTTKGGLGTGPQAASPREGGGEPRRDPPPLSPQPPRRPASHGGAGPPAPPEAEGMIPPPAGRTAAPGREGGAGPASTPQPLALAGTAMDKLTHANTQGRHTDRARRQQASTNRSGMGATPSMARATPRTLALLPAQRGRATDGGKVTPRPTGPPGQTVGENGTQAAPSLPPTRRRWNAPDAQTHPTGSTQPQAR